MAFDFETLFKEPVAGVSIRDALSDEARLIVDSLAYDPSLIQEMVNTAARHDNFSHALAEKDQAIVAQAAATQILRIMTDPSINTVGQQTLILANIINVALMSGESLEGILSMQKAITTASKIPNIVTIGMTLLGRLQASLRRKD
jgi:hypothetical protein